MEKPGTQLTPADFRLLPVVTFKAHVRAEIEDAERIAEYTLYRCLLRLLEGTLRLIRAAKAGQLNRWSMKEVADLTKRFDEYIRSIEVDPSGVGCRATELPGNLVFPTTRVRGSAAIAVFSWCRVVISGPRLVHSRREFERRRTESLRDRSVRIWAKPAVPKAGLVRSMERRLRDELFKGGVLPKLRQADTALIPPAGADINAARGSTTRGGTPRPSHQQRVAPAHRGQLWSLEMTKTEMARRLRMSPKILRIKIKSGEFQVDRKGRERWQLRLDILDPEYRRVFDEATFRAESK